MDTNFNAALYQEEMLSLVNTAIKKLKAEHPDYTGKEEFNFFLSVVFPYDQLTILPYHRIVKDIKGMEPKAFIGSMKFNFELMAMPGFPCKPVEKHCFGLEPSSFSGTDP